MILIINGPNLNLLGKREPSIYGTQSFEEILNDLQKDFPEQNLTYYQNNSEGALIDKIHNVNPGCIGIILNAGAYTHTSLALADAISAISIPVIEVHLSNVFAREEIRHKSLIAAACIGSISGFAKDSYFLAITYLAKRMKPLKE